MKSKVKIFFTVIIILSMILTGCGNKVSQNNSDNNSSDVENTVAENEIVNQTDESNESEVENKDEEVNEDKEVVDEEAENLGEEETENKEETQLTEEDSTESGQGSDIENYNEQLAALLPSNIGYTWEYIGSFDYEHTATLNSIDKNEDELIYHISGEVKEYAQEEELDEPFMLNDEETEKEQIEEEQTEEETEEGQENQDYEEYDEFDNSIELQYIIKDGELVQKKKSIAMMDTFFDELILIKAPLEEKTTWTQKLKDVEGNEYSMQGTITWKRVKDGKTLYNVEYEDIDGDRHEERVIEEGVGVIDYKCDYILDELKMQYGYELK